MKKFGWTKRKIYRADNDFVSSITLMNKDITLGGADITQEYIIKDSDIVEIDNTIELLEQYFSGGSLMPKSTKNSHQAILEEAEAESGWQNSIMDGLRYVGGEETTKMLNNMETSKANISMMTSAPGF